MAEDLLTKCREYVKTGKYEKAQIILRRILDEDPNSAGGLELSADLSYKMGNIKEAIQKYEHASNNHTDNNEYNRAIICLEKIIKIDKSKEEIFFRLADLYRFFGLPNEAVRKILEFCSWAIENKEEAIFIAGLRKIIELQPKNLSLRFAFVKVLLAVQREQEASDELKKLKELAEEVKDEHLLAEIEKLKPKYDGGDELDPKSRVELGNLLYEIGSKDEALVEFFKAASDLIAGGETDEAIGVLTRIIEIDPDNPEATAKLTELKAGAKKEEGVVSAEPSPTKPPEEMVTQTPEEKIPKPNLEEGMEILRELGDEVEGFVSVTEQGKEEEPTEELPRESAPEEFAPLEGQIADIEFLLKEAEAPPAPSFEVAKEFDEFRTNIIWEPENVIKKISLAKMAFDAELYETSLMFIEDIKDDKSTWPETLEIRGACLIKIGRYGEAISAIGSVILLEGIPEGKKTELRYLLSLAYQGIGDFENALRGIEHILNTNPNYKDTKEIYELLGGKKEFPPAEIPMEEAPPIRKEAAPEPEKITEPITQEEQPAIAQYASGSEEEEKYPTIVEKPPEIPKEKPPENIFEEPPETEEKGEPISFL